MCFPSYKEDIFRRQIAEWFAEENIFSIVNLAWNFISKEMFL